MTAANEKAVRDILAFYTEAGVDAAVGETPVDRLSEPPAPVPASIQEPAKAAAPPAPRTFNQDRRQGQPAPAQIVQAGGPAPLPSPDAAAMAAREAARHAGTLDDLRAILDSFEGCALRATASRLVFARGNPQARVMLVGEAPGYEEDQSGLPFVGRSGQLLDRMLAAIGLDESSVYIANIVPWRPPGNRTPTPQESSICLPFILRQIELANPDVLVCMGNPSTQTLLNTREGITRTRGRWFPFQTGTREIRAMPTYHPAFLLRSPVNKRLAWRDLLAIKKALAQ
jgi:DNA polymerase